MVLLVSLLIVSTGAACGAFFSRLAAHLLSLDKNMVNLFTFIGCAVCIFVGCANTASAALLVDSTQWLSSIEAFIQNGLLLAVVTGAGCAVGISFIAISIVVAKRIGAWVDRPSGGNREN